VFAGVASCPVTLNQRVHGSSPCAPTIEINELEATQYLLAFVSGPVADPAGAATVPGQAQPNCSFVIWYYHVPCLNLVHTATGDQWSG
jgi:hypothetical protein